MKWEEVRETFPNEWIVFEALQAHSKNNQRIIEDLAIIDRYEDSLEALRRHAELHKQNPRREYYFFHTSREKLNILEKNGWEYGALDEYS